VHGYDWMVCIIGYGREDVKVEEILRQAQDDRWEILPDRSGQVGRLRPSTLAQARRDDRIIRFWMRYAYQNDE
jgi:hypothetical protein